MKNRKRFLALLILLILMIPLRAFAQETQIDLDLYLIRNFGYGGLGKIQGNFTIRIQDPPLDLDYVEFYLDQDMIAVMKSAPFEYKFHTSDYQDGDHVFSAIGFLTDGNRVESNRITKVFLSSDQAGAETQQLVIPILLFTAGITVLGLGISVLASRNKKFALGKYGPAGGAVCPRCELPFTRSYLAPNLMIGKLVRCPHCGKISVLPRANQDQIRRAEDKYRNEDPTRSKPVDEQTYQKLIDDSRFED